MKLSPFYSLLILSLVFSGCSRDNQDNNERAGIDSLAQNLASRQIEKSFEVKKVDTLAATEAQKINFNKSSKKNSHNKKLNMGVSVDKAHVVIQKSALGKEFLFSVNILSQTPTPMFSSLQSRVVSFILRDGKVYLLDVTKNNAVASETNIPQTLVLAEFAILKETKTSLEIDFNSGMKQIFVTGDMAASGHNPSGAEYELLSSKVRLSYLDEVTLSNSALFIRQIAQIDDSSGAMPVEVRYQIKPYLPDPSFIPMKSPGFDKVGYFEANPLLLADGSTRIYAMKWNEKKSIQFAISANTPEKYRALVKSALLYWNKILGDKAIEVVQLEDKTQTAPRFDLNIIQWVDWDMAGFAFADAHVDPRSGEVTSAQIFFTSAFLQGNVTERVRAIQAARPVATFKELGLKGFKSATLCNRNLRDDLALREMAEGVSSEAMDKAVRDYVYEVIAHELGHVLGLRHNFAGSLAANYDFKDRKKLAMSYYKNMKAPVLDTGVPVVTSSSVMEYSLFEESAWNGDLFRNGAKALAYDEMAIRYLYFKTPLPTENRPLFCTDSDVKTYADCNRHDAGRSVISAAAGAYQFNLNTLAADIINTYIAYSKKADSLATNLVPVTEVNLNAKGWAAYLGWDLAKLVSLMKDGTRFIAVRSQFMPVLSTMKSEIDKREKDYLQTEFARLGGLETLTKEISENFEAELISKFSELIEDPLYNSGVLADGTAYAFTSDEKESMKKNMTFFAQQIKEQLILNELMVLSGEERSWLDSDLTYELSNILLKRFAHYSLAKTTGKIVSEITQKDGTKKQVELPVYQHAQNIRMAAVGILLSAHKAVDLGYREKQAALKLLEAEMALFGDPKNIDMLSLDRNTLQWYLNNKKLITLLTE